MRTPSDALPPLALLLAWLAAVWVVGIYGNFPLNDDWQYAWPVQQLLERGVLEMQGFFAPNIILQVGWGYLFCAAAGGFDFEWLRLSTLVLALSGGIVLFMQLRRWGIMPAWSALGAAILLFNPLYFSLSFTFMTDVPFLAVVLLSLYAFERHINTRSPGALAAACLFAVAAYLIRQPGIVLLPAYGLWQVWEQRGKRRSIALALLMTASAVAVYFAYERLGKPRLGIGENFVPVSGAYMEALRSAPLAWAAELGRKAVKTWIYLGFFGLPLLPFLGQAIRRSGLLRRRAAFMLLAANLFLLAFLHYAGKIFPFGGNILYNFGLGPELLADVYTFGLPNTPRLPEWIRYAVQGLSQLSATALLWVGVANWRELQAGQRRFFRFLIVVNVLYLPLMSITSFFDRYVLLHIASMMLWLLPHVRKPARVWTAWAPLMFMTAFSIAATRDYLEWNRARHVAWNWLQEQGVSIRETDAGYEYNGWYNFHKNRIPAPGRSFWWVTDDAWMIAFGGAPGYEVVREFPFRRWLWAGRMDAVVVLHRK